MRTIKIIAIALGIVGTCCWIFAEVATSMPLGWAGVALMLVGFFMLEALR